MNKEELKERTKQFALDVISFVDSLPNTRKINLIERQLVRSATSVCANYRAACRAHSHAHFIYKLNIVLEEADESQYWLEVILALNVGENNGAKRLHSEANELVAIFASSINTARKRK